MKSTHIFTLIAAGLSLTPGVSAGLGFGASCLSAERSLAKVPSRFLEKLYEHACEAGCQPKPDQWHTYGKKALNDMIDEGEKFCQIDSPDGKEALTRYLDAEYTEMVDKCAPKLKDSNLCEESDEKNEFQKCIKSSVRTIPSGRLAKLLPHISEDRCKKVNAYLNSKEMWDEHLVARGKSYLEHCHDEL